MLNLKIQGAPLLIRPTRRVWKFKILASSLLALSVQATQSASDQCACFFSFFLITIFNFFFVKLHLKEKPS